MNMFWLMLLLFFIDINVDEFYALKETEIIDSRNFEFQYNFSLQCTDQAQNLDIWIPLPQSDNNQQLSRITIESPIAYELKKDTKFNNEFMHVHFAESPPASVDIRVKIEAVRKKTKTGSSLATQSLEEYLGADDLVPIDGEIAKEAAIVIKNIQSKLDQARAIYDHIVSTVKYDKSGFGWGIGDALYVCDARKGNCTDFHSLFIGMCRAVGIPSRFVIGFPLPEKMQEGVVNGYHCWAEFYIDERGWIPVDASEAFKNPEKKDFFFGNLDANRIQFSIGRDILLEEGPTITKQNYFIYPFCMHDGVLCSNSTTTFYFKDLPE